jgi:hypothetical protein
MMYIYPSVKYDSPKVMLVAQSVVTSSKGQDWLWGQASSIPNEYRGLFPEEKRPEHEADDLSI